MEIAKLGAVLAAAIVVIGASLGISKIGSSAMEAIARQPEAADGIRMAMIIIGALVEGFPVRHHRVPAGGFVIFACHGPFDA